jgi:hypothetical protein
MANVTQKKTEWKNVLNVNEAEIRTHLDEVVRQSVEETLNL